MAASLGPGRRGASTQPAPPETSAGWPTPASPASILVTQWSGCSSGADSRAGKNDGRGAAAAAEPALLNWECFATGFPNWETFNLTTVHFAHMQTRC
eukprot:COSAG06_NODE_7147_length_2610_cov_12.164476_2_plen_97_part_00